MTSRNLESTHLEVRAKVFSALSDPIRLQILDDVAGCIQCVCDIQEKVDIAPNLLSYHLRVLREAGLVTATRRGRWMDYTMADDAATLIADALPARLRGDT